MSPIELRVLPLSHLKPAPYNPRRVLDPDSPAYRKLRASLAEFGLVEPLVWTELTGLPPELEGGPELELTGFDARAVAALRLEPAAAVAGEPEADPDRVEVTLVTDAATYERLAADLDALVGRFDLVTHVRRGATS